MQRKFDVREYGGLPTGRLEQLFEFSMHDQTISVLEQTCDFDTCAWISPQDRTWHLVVPGSKGVPNTSWARLSIFLRLVLLVRRPQPLMEPADGRGRRDPEVSDVAHCAATPIWWSTLVGTMPRLVRGGFRVFGGGWS